MGVRFGIIAPIVIYSIGVKFGVHKFVIGRVVFAFLNVPRTHKSSFQKEQKRGDISTPFPSSQSKDWKGILGVLNYYGLHALRIYHVI